MSDLEITVTPAAIAHVVRQIRKRGHGIGLVLGTRTTGCSGMAYTIEYADVLSDDQIVLKVEGVIIATDTQTAILLKGAALDFVRSGLNEGLTFENPNERGRCGCGESFRV
jgi:iron-sulfur cluster assembly protein